MSYRHAGVVLGAAGCVISLSATCFAAEPTANRVSLRWAAPDECPDDARLVHEVEALLGRSLPDAVDQPPSLNVRVHVQGSGERGYAAKLSFTSAQGAEDRFLEHPSCDKLVDAVALVVALAIDPERVHATQLARETDSSAPSAQVEPTPAPVRAITEPRPARVEQCGAPVIEPERGLFRGLRLAFHGAVGAGSLPNAGSGFDVALGWHREVFRMDAVGRFWLPRTAPVSGLPAKLELGLATLGVRGCVLPLRGAWQFSGCAGGDLGDMRGDGLGVVNEHTRHARYSDLAVDARVAYSDSGLALEGGLELSGALERPEFGISEDGRGTLVFRPRSWGLSAFFGVAFEL